MKKLISQIFIISIAYISVAYAEYKLPPLPYAENALEPYISAKTLSFHYGKHHQGYVDTLNKLIKEENIGERPLEDLIKLEAQLAAKDSKFGHQKETSKTVFNNAAQTWNHTFYWSSMKPKGGGKPTGKVAELINQSFGSYDEFKKQFIEAGQKLFGSGWVWLVRNNSGAGALTILTTKDADLPLLHNSQAILVCDIWEHAYYLDYQNRRIDYVTVFLDHLVNWDFASKNLGGAI